ncbi:hypothetical protein HWV00_17095 [Moritella sp. 24]|uniref:hypothetical protein n=1 Tax=Moritella sp. 24 TaxID=2746230 RepID=UPI001BA95304|nr:hypothetical protein [Moritella sp. 24]QUM77801.1 hypothetical protein HWV00_17095 [Moritella sp. 24]
MAYIIDHENIDIRSLGHGVIASYPFIVLDTRYTCWFTELTIDLESVEDTVREIEEDGVYEPGLNTFKVDFDLEVNFLTYDEDQLFIIPENGYGNGIASMRDITSAVTEIIQIHQEAFDCIFYFAEPATRQHDLLYRRNVIPQLEESGYSYYVLDENRNEGNTYIFLKDLEEGEAHG